MIKKNYHIGIIATPFFLVFLGYILASVSERQRDGRWQSKEVMGEVTLVEPTNSGHEYDAYGARVNLWNTDTIVFVTTNAEMKPQIGDIVVFTQLENEQTGEKRYEYPRSRPTP